MVRLYIIRHADPDYDTDRENGGSLTDHGKLEAKALGEYLKSEGLTHAYTSPMGRARLTAELALKDNFPTLLENLKVEPWTKELSSWRQTSSIAGNIVMTDDSRDVKVGEGEGTADNLSDTKMLIKPRAIWDLPASVTRSKLSSCITGTDNEIETPTGWRHTCLDHAHHAEKFDQLCKNSDEFLARHGVFRCGQRYLMYNEENACNSLSSEQRKARIAVFCHGGFGLTWLAHLLGIPLPLFYSSFYLSPSSVSIILFDEHNNYPDIHFLTSQDKGAGNNYYINTLNGLVPERCIWMTPRAICVGGTNHLSMNNLETPNSKYENWSRPSGIKANFW